MGEAAMDVVDNDALAKMTRATALTMQTGTVRAVTHCVI